MKFGCCGGINEIKEIKYAGADFIELPVVTIANMDTDPLKSMLKDVSISPYSFNIFLPGDLKITGPAVDKEKVEIYVNKAMEKVGRLGGKIIVFGSGRARTFPENYSLEKGKQDIVNFLNIVSKYAQKFNIKIAIEPLNKKESNILNTTLEALEIARILNNPYIGVLFDNYHAEIEKEPLSNLEKIGDKLYHVHLSNKDRTAPGEKDYDFKKLFSVLKYINYKGGISIESSFNDRPKELPHSLEYLKNIWNTLLFTAG
ncbi:MAG: sugar phosphate isomerase/epimerase [Candidatus Omnitrophica bacterium]|nr:sugar phosphate isomerase/epimerase [Candidatus Omnitrophota bacterium]